MKQYNHSILENIRAATGRQSRNDRGFTLFELIMVMTIIVILAAVSVTAYQNIQLKARETILKQNLREMRIRLDEYAADRETMPQSLEELVSAGYLRELPIDPITEQSDWIVEYEEDDISIDGGQGISNVRSNAPGEGSDGVAYREY